MVSALFNDSNYVATKKVLDATVLRHTALAANLAGIEVPNYQRVDMDPSFSAELRQALASQDAGQINALRPQVVVDANAISHTPDGNTVQLEKELMELQKNFVAHAAETQLLSSHLLRLRLAITGRS